jgi:crotonobetainyl-CoA:carnitine CoA-transferase CaiB-like acyl-CoA transferase
VEGGESQQARDHARPAQARRPGALQAAAAALRRAGRELRPGTLDRWGLPRETLWALQPKLTILRVTGFGKTGPYASTRALRACSRPTRAHLHHAATDGAPTHPSYPIGDPISGVFGAFGVLAALVHRMKHPEAPGQEIDLSCTEAMMRMLEVLPIEYEQLGLVHGRTGSSNAFVAPAGMFRSGDGEWVTFTAATQSVFERFCALIEREDLLADPRYVDNRRA